jgi:HSP20 family protein
MAETNAVTRREKAEVARPEATWGGALFSPRVDIYEANYELVVACDLPGVRPEDLEVRFENGELQLHGKVTPRQMPNGLLHEYVVGDFYRAFTISEDIDVEKISAELKHGVLTVRLPKKEALKPKKISVKTE